MQGGVGSSNILKGMTRTGDVDDELLSAPKIQLFARNCGGKCALYSVRSQTWADALVTSGRFAFRSSSPGLGASAS